MASEARTPSRSFIPATGDDVGNNAFVEVGERSDGTVAVGAMRCWTRPRERMPHMSDEQPIVHAYAPGPRPLCGYSSVDAEVTAYPDRVTGPACLTAREPTSHQRWLQDGHCHYVHWTKAWCNDDEGHEGDHWAVRLTSGGMEREVLR